MSERQILLHTGMEKFQDYIIKFKNKNMRSTHIHRNTWIRKKGD
jgi:hypothetical protein